MLENIRAQIERLSDSDYSGVNGNDLRQSDLDELNNLIDDLEMVVTAVVTDLEKI